MTYPCNFMEEQVKEKKPYNKKEYMREYSKKYYQEHKEEKREWSKEYRKKNPTKSRELALLADFGITLLEYNQMLQQQQGLCAACGKPERIVEKSTGKTRNLAVDHCHTTGKVRGLLCYTCNIHLGLYEKYKEDFESYLKGK